MGLQFARKFDTVFRHMSNQSNWFDSYLEVPADPIMQANLDFLADSRINKVNAGIGMIMDPKTKKPFVSPTLKKIGKEIAFDDNGYLPSHGFDEYLDIHAQQLIFGDALWGRIKSTIVKAQTIGGTNALELAGELLDLGLSINQKQLLLDSGWPNHPKIFKKFNIINYQHENPKSRTYNHTVYIEKLTKLPKRNIVVVQVGGYNDDGTERNEAQWEEIVQIIKEQDHIPILDFAYNGLVNGWGTDASPVRMFTQQGIIAFICASNSKNVAYNARLGSLYVVNLPRGAAENMQGTLSNNLIRPFFSNPPAFAAQTFARILGDSTLREEYKKEVDDIRVNLLKKNRQILSEALGSDYRWIIDKRGMFLKLKLDGFSDAQLKFLKEDNAIHGPKSSRLNMGGFEPDRMKEIAEIYKKALTIS